MCRFNLIMIKDEKSEEILFNEGYHKMFNNLIGYKAFQKGYCNCDSFVGSLIEKKGMNYYDVIAKSKKDKLERLYYIKNMMNQSDYKERKEIFLQNQTKLSEEMHVLSQHIGDYELVQSDAIDEKYSGKDHDKQMEKLYKEISEMYIELEARPDFQKSNDIYRKFLSENDLMNESTRYYLTKKEEEEKNQYEYSTPLLVLVDSKENQNLENAKTIQVEVKSLIIDEVICRTEKEEFLINIVEYNYYEKLLSNLLNYDQSVIFSTIWSEPNELKIVKTIGIDSFKIDDLAFLDYDDAICLTK